MKAHTFIPQGDRMYRDETMDKENQLLVLFSGAFGLLMAVFLAKPKGTAEAVWAMLGGLFTAVVIAPAVAEIVTNLANTFTYLAWIKAEPGSSLYVGIVGISSMLGFQVVVELKTNFIAWVKTYANKWANGRDRNDNN